MSESEWLTSVDPLAMLEWLTGEGIKRVPPQATRDGRLVGDRKLRLFVAVGLAIVLPGSKLRPQVEAMADDPTVPHDRRWWATSADVYGAARCVVTAALMPEGRKQLAALLRDLVNPFRPATLPESVMGEPTVQLLASRAYEDRQADGTLDPLTLMALADALAEAGCPGEQRRPKAKARHPLCDNGCCAECDACAKRPGSPVLCGDCLKRRAACKGVETHPLLAHLRSAGVHVRGCWAIDCIRGAA
jgi:hypothetical protein